MYRLTRLLFSPFTCLGLLLMSMAVGTCSLVVAVLGYIGAYGGASNGPETLKWGITVTVVAAHAAAFFLVALLPSLAIRSIIVTFWPDTRPWLYFGPKPGASATSSGEATSQQTLPANTPPPYSDADLAPSHLPEHRNRENETP